MRFRIVFSLLILLFVWNKSYSTNRYKLVRPESNSETNFSGDKQHGRINTMLSKPIRFQVLKDDSIPIPDFPIHISTLSTPQNSDGFKCSQQLLYTGLDGIAELQITLGDTEGEYELIATIESLNKQNFVAYKFFARSNTWLIFMVIGLIGGLALFLYGMHMLSNGLQKTAGDKMRSILGRLTHNNFIAIAVGAVTTMIIQSSSATSVMLVSFVNSGLMRFKQTLGIILGAAIGTTITAQIIAFKITDYSMIMIGVGALAFLFAQKDSFKNIGETLLGFGLLFFGMDIMSDAMYPLRSYEPFLNILLQLENPVIGILVGAIFTAIIQSSSAFIGIMIILATQNLLTIESSLALLLGANLGTPVTAILASIKTTVEAKKVAFAQLGYKLILVIIFIGFIPQTIKLLDIFLPIDTTNSLPRNIANAHTLYNVILTAIALPFITLYAKLINKLMPDKTSSTQWETTKYIDPSVISSPALAISLAKQETIRLGSKILRTLDVTLKPFLLNDPKYLDDIIERRIQNKAIRDAIRSYLLKIDNSTTTNKRVSEVFQIIHTVNELSHINDELTKILHRRAEKWIARNYEFSSQGKEEIIDYHQHTKNILHNALNVFKSMNLEEAKKVQKKRKKLSILANTYEKHHYERLVNKNPKEILNAKTYLELVHTFNQIINHSGSIVKTFIDRNDNIEME